jgi:hypothetical protein
LILTNFVAELGAVVGEELQGGLAIGTVLGDSGLDLAGVRAADSLRIGRVGLLTRCQSASGLHWAFLPFLRTYPITLRTQAGVCTAITTLAKATMAMAKIDLLKSMMKDWRSKIKGWK